jgi:AcrR family transcriptional regulator
VVSSGETSDRHDGASAAPDSARGAAGDAERAAPTDAAAALVAAAGELFRERSPAAVPLREIAQRAGVNYGLIHHYFRTKAAILAEVFAESSRAGAERLADAADVGDGIQALTLHGERNGYVQMLAWVMLEGATPPGFFRPSPALAKLSELIEAERARPTSSASPTLDVDDRVIAAAAVAALMGWAFFHPFLRAAAGIEDRDVDDLTDDVSALVLQMVRGAAPG